LNRLADRIHLMLHLRLFFKKSLNRFFQGFCIGTANIIPGVSGGTIALMLGIYSELIHAMGCLDLKLLRLLTARRFHAAGQYLPWRFLVPVLAGIALAVVLLARFLEWLFDYYPVYIYAYFFGLILASVPVIMKHIRYPHLRTHLLLLIAAGCMYILVGMVPAQTPQTALFIFVSGALAISTMILPGISGSFVLVLIGKYKFILAAINDRNLFVLSVFGLGCLVGIISVVRFLKWLLDRHHDMTMAVLAGMVLGSLPKLWPWKVNINTAVLNSAGQVYLKEINVLPQRWGGEVGWAVLICLLGLVTAWLLARGQTSSPKH